MTTTVDAATSAPTAAAKTGLPSADTDYQTFLNMMTTQMKNQDPMNPMNSDQFAMQLATFSGVEQQTRTNALLTQLLTSANGQTMAQMAGWVGQEARISAPVHLDGAPVTLSPNPALDADTVQMAVADGSGTEVARIAMPLSSANYEWDGKDQDGKALPPGTYSLTLDSFKDGTLLGSNSLEYYAQVQEIRAGADGVTVLVPGQIEVSSANVTALRAPVPAL